MRQEHLLQQDHIAACWCIQQADKVTDAVCWLRLMRPSSWFEYGWICRFMEGNLVPSLPSGIFATLSQVSNLFELCVDVNCRVTDGAFVSNQVCQRQSNQDNCVWHIWQPLAECIHVRRMWWCALWLPIYCLFDWLIDVVRRCGNGGGAQCTGLPNDDDV